MPGTYKESTRAKGFVAISTIPLYVYISFCKYRNRIACKTAPHSQFNGPRDIVFDDLPAGSLRWERFVRSSLASSIVGFIRGGREALFACVNASSVASIDLVCQEV